MNKKSMTLLAVGDVILEKPGGTEFLSLVAPVLKKGDVVVGQGEVLFTDRGVKTFVENFPAPAAPPENMKAMADAGFNVITLAGNHAYDQGAPAIEDTIAGLKKLGVAYCGAGMNIDEARAPAMLERGGTKFGFLNYNCVGPMGENAHKFKPGCAYVQILSHYEMNTANPGGSPDVYTFATPRTLKAMVEDIQKLRLLCDVLTVCFHKGILGMPETLAMYDQQVSYAAIDAGADLIIGHHAHMLKAIEFYKGKAIFHGLGQFVSVGQGLTDAQRKEMRALAAPNLSTYVLRLDPARNLTMIAKCVIENRKISRVSYIPCLINDYQKPEVLKNDEKGRQVFEFVDRITKAAGLNVKYEWEGDEVAIR
jgi:poly-gamma-glutamate capsule biosynthesis protein CapA/YwtB (metallophosphatase superfamily)